MSAISRRDIKREITNDLRSADLISISTRGVTTTTEEFDGTGSQTNFILTGTGSGNGGIKNVRTVTVNAVVQVYGTDWDITNDFSTVIFTTAPVFGTDNVDITYDFSSTGDRIYPDFSKTTISNDNFPRIGFDIITTTTIDKALQGAITQSNLVISFVAYQKGANATDDLHDAIRAFLLTKKLSWFFLNFLTPTGDGPLLVVPESQDKVFQRNTDFRAPYEFEVN